MQNDNQNEILNLSPEIDEDRKKGKGYTTILANIAGDVHRRDIEKAEKLQAEKQRGSNFIRRLLKKFRRGNKEASIAAEDISGLKKNDVYEEDVIIIEGAEDDEMKLTIKRKINNLNKSGILRFNSKDYLVLDIIQQEGKEEITYHLKAC